MSAVVKEREAGLSPVKPGDVVGAVLMEGYLRYWLASHTPEQRTALENLINPLNTAWKTVYVHLGRTYGENQERAVRAFVATGGRGIVGSAAITELARNIDFLGDLKRGRGVAILGGSIENDELVVNLVTALTGTFGTTSVVQVGQERIGEKLGTRIFGKVDPDAGVVIVTNAIPLNTIRISDAMLAENFVNRLMGGDYTNVLGEGVAAEQQEAAMKELKKGHDNRVFVVVLPPEIIDPEKLNLTPIVLPGKNNLTVDLDGMNYSPEGDQALSIALAAATRLAGVFRIFEGSKPAVATVILDTLRKLNGELDQRVARAIKYGTVEALLEIWTKRVKEQAIAGSAERAKQIRSAGLDKLLARGNLKAWWEKVQMLQNSGLIDVPVEMLGAVACGDWLEMIKDCAQGGVKVSIFNRFWPQAVSDAIGWVKVQMSPVKAKGDKKEVEIPKGVSSKMARLLQLPFGLGANLQLFDLPRVSPLIDFLTSVRGSIGESQSKKYAQLLKLVLQKLSINPMVINYYDGVATAPAEFSQQRITSGGELRAAWLELAGNYLDRDCPLPIWLSAATGNWGPDGLPIVTGTTAARTGFGNIPEITSGRLWVPSEHTVDINRSKLVLDGELHANGTVAAVYIRDGKRISFPYARVLEMDLGEK